jgi:nitrogen regulatory protein PII
MHAVKRIEMMADSVEVSRILAVFEQVGVAQYVVLPNASGRGTEDLGVGALAQDFVIAFCSDDQLKPLVEQIRPILNKFGGACFISDAMEVRSMRCVSSL